MAAGYENTATVAPSLSYEATWEDVTGCSRTIVRWFLYIQFMALTFLSKIRLMVLEPSAFDVKQRSLLIIDCVCVGLTVLFSVSVIL